MAAKNLIIKEHARMWPREVFYRLGRSEGRYRFVRNESGNGKKIEAPRGLELLNQPGVYVLYRDGVPYYVGQATKLHDRLWAHAYLPGARYHNFWNHFSAFVIEKPSLRNQVEGILIAAMPTANGAKPKLQRAKMPDVVIRMSREIYKHQANPNLEFDVLTRRLVEKMDQLMRRQKQRKAA
jgi:hypothetical protein